MTPGISKPTSRPQRGLKNQEKAVLRNAGPPFCLSLFLTELIRLLDFLVFFLDKLSEVIQNFPEVLFLAGRASLDGKIGLVSEQNLEEEGK